ncbi:MAG: hypothetical protein LRZ92_00580, partial [Methanosarcinaceae archaeon]|nr:hypothetical protein [Methanosarcinaceae archaeon]
IAPGKSIAHITVPLTLAAGGRPIDLNRNRTTITYTDDTIHIPNVYTKPRGTLIEAASLEWIARHDNDNILEFGELAIFTIPIDGAPTNADLRANEQFTITIQPPQGAVLTIKRTIPPNINPKSILRT